MKIAKITKQAPELTVDIEVGNTHSYQLSNGAVSHNTTSLVVGSSSGIHAWHAPYYVRRMRVGKNEALYEYIKSNFPLLIEDCRFKPHIESVLTIPQKAPEGAVLRSESAIEFLERVKKFNLEWVRPGHRSGANYHNVSCTVSIGENEWEEVGEWMWQHSDTYTGISVLPRDDHSYVQAPFEDITKEVYESYQSYLHGIDLTEVKEYDDITNHAANSAACQGNVCEIVSA